jgi:transposase InsO family protein
VLGPCSRSAGVVIGSSHQITSHLTNCLGRLSLVSRSAFASSTPGRRGRRILRDHGITCSMSRLGNCYDNAVMETWFSTLPVERLDSSTLSGPRSLAPPRRPRRRRGSPERGPRPGRGGARERQTSRRIERDVASGIGFPKVSGGGKIPARRRRNATGERIRCVRPSGQTFFNRYDTWPRARRVQRYSTLRSIRSSPPGYQ